MGTPSQRILIWPHYKRVHVNSQQYLYNLAARAAETSCFQQQNSRTQLRVKAHWSSSARRCGVPSWVLEAVTERIQSRPDWNRVFPWKLKEEARRPGRSMHKLVLHTNVTVTSASSHLLHLNYQGIGGCIAVSPIPIPCTQRLCKGDFYGPFYRIFTLILTALSSIYNYFFNHT